ncbi:MAG: DUF120 domain-containing protein [Candidatus Diapherotrites archaeon]
MKEDNFSLFLAIAKQAKLEKEVYVSTSALSSITGYSQQSISRKLIEMEKEGLITRKASNLGTLIKITEKGKKELESIYFELSTIFSAPKQKTISGKVVSGLGEGKYYTQLPKYKEQFKKLFDIDLFPGTLNLLVDETERKNFTLSYPIKVKGFKETERTFGGIDCWQVKVNNAIDAIAIIPHRTNHPQNILEIVSDKNLRKELNLKNGSLVELSLIQTKKVSK